jgi:L-2-hydroxyglutarate oxidase LhgO
VTETTDCIVIGAGVVGLAIARAMAIAGREVIVLEGADAIGTATSSRNSEVVHAGIYYPEGSLKAQLCVEGRRQMYQFCDTHGVSAKKTTKLIFAANDSEIDGLKNLQAHAERNDVALEWLSASEVSRLEPNLDCASALLSPETGILDSHGFMLALQGDAERYGAVIAFNSPVIKGCSTGKGVELRVGDHEETVLEGKTVINCAGLGAQEVSHSIVGANETAIPHLHYAKGSYFYLSGKAPFSRLIYPLPGSASLGLHYTLDLSGQARFGPDIEWIDSINYTVEPSTAGHFYKAIRKYWPSLKDGELRPGYSGIRPKLQSKGSPVEDFCIQFPQETGCLGYCALYGIESPGLTASLAIADYVVKHLS